MKLSTTPQLELQTDYSGLTPARKSAVVIDFAEVLLEEEAAEAARVGGAWLCDVATREGV